MEYEYNPEKFWKENTVESILKDLEESMRKEREWKKKTNWKPDFMMPVGFVKTENLNTLKWLSENYRLMGGQEAVKTLRQRQMVIQYTLPKQKMPPESSI